MDRTPPSAAPPPLDPEDFYFEGEFLVFTAAYHRKRGFCCGSGCRHCPDALAAAPAPADAPPPTG